ncbi:hypothetical protein Tsubulata_026659, partial [Turnera subulata]
VELIFIPIAAAGHIVSTVELAKLLIDRDERLSIHPPHEVTSSQLQQLRFIQPGLEPDPSLDPRKHFTSIIENNKQQVKETVSKISSSSGGSSPKLAGFVLDVMCTPMIDVANEFGVPSYIYCGAAFLGMIFHEQDLHDEQGTEPTEFEELVLPSLENPLPAPKSLPSPFLYKEGIQMVLN